MEKFLGRFREQTYAVMRIVVGFMFLCHGLQKLGFIGEKSVPLGSLAGAAAIIEAVGGILILVGFLAGWAAFICSGEMAVAYFKVHQGGGLLPIKNHGELAVLYCFVFLYIAARGAGIWSIDSLLGRKGA